MMNANTEISAQSSGLTPAAIKKTTFFTVFVNDNVFGLEVKEAQAIFRVGLLTPIPLAQREIAGFINQRGKVVVAVSLRRRIGAREPEGARETIAIGLERGGEHFALLVDRVGDVLSLPDTARTAIPSHCDESQSRFTRELYVHESKLIPILEVQRLFDFAY
jgi:purine-binding chemotaxis protein CheW